MIRLLQLFPEHLDLNGDAGNLLILQRRAQWGGLSVTIEKVGLGAGLPQERPDVVLIGHGSSAAWRQAYPALKALIPAIEQWVQQGTQVIAINSGFAALHGLLPALPSTIERLDERFSNFVVEDFDGHVLAGYKNTDLLLENLLLSENLIGSALHGPLLAKNLWLADRILGRVVALRPEVRAAQGEVDGKRFSQVAALAKAAIELATEIAAN